MEKHKEQLVEFYIGSKKINCYRLDEWPHVPLVGDFIKITTTKGLATLKIVQRRFDYVSHSFKCYCEEEK